MKDHVFNNPNRDNNNGDADFQVFRRPVFLQLTR